MRCWQLWTLVPRQLLSGHGAYSLAQALRCLYTRLLQGRTATPPAMMPGQIPDLSMTAGSLPGLDPLTGLPRSALTAEELKWADIHNIGAMMAPLYFLEVKLSKRPQPVKSELDKEEERRYREKNKVAAAQCRNKNEEQKEFLQRNLSDWSS
ncbi:LOW QUALITY PROTEIN: hypothetical protein QTO34_015873 [Cnephaeus nilssonii]|uniref:BZIP domain-containing protein n=1 Tax=Cnephaeus nilssonii TaxID=3371016 RepID=A0AA40I5X8_CNENI|nr:LOW QUALITY PROTEIN: hypothetical protein QTO34_015873 [Eptesicus nilssonii]